MKFTVSMKKNHEFRRLYSRGKSYAVSNLVIYYKPFSHEGTKLGLTVSTKVGKAVVRNKVRRRLREIYRSHEEELKTGLDMVIVARIRAATASYAQLERDFLYCIKKLDLKKTEKKEEN